MKKIKYILVFLFVSAFAKAQQLQSYIQEAEANNPEIQAFELRYNIAEEKVNEANWIPNTEVSAGYFVSEPETRVGAQRARIGVKQMLPWFGTITARENYATAMADAEYVDITIAKRKLALSVAQTYYRLYGIRAKQAVLDENIKLLETYERLALTSVEVGKASAVDVDEEPYESRCFRSLWRARRGLAGPRGSHSRARSGPGAGQDDRQPGQPVGLLYVRGRYSIIPNLPASPGFEGVGVVDAAGSGLYGKSLVGRRVAVINGDGGNWAEQVVIPAFQAIPVPGRLPDEQVASFFVNPATVLAMVRHELKVPKGGWLLQSAANSELGKMIIRLGQHDGFKTVNVVRRPEAAEELKALGADAVIVTTDGPIPDQVRQVTGTDDVRFALDPVGGDIGTGVFESLAGSGTLLAYGSLTGEPIRVNTRLMISGRRVLRGFWLGHFMRSRSKVAALPLFFQVGRLIRSGVLSTSIGPSFSLDQLNEATRAAEQSGRTGKILLRLGE